VTIGADDRIGLLATAAGVLSLHRLQVRAARVVTVGDRAVQVWSVQPLFGDPPSVERLTEDLRLALEGSLDLQARLRAREDAYAHVAGARRAEPRVDVLTQVSDRATILEVRAHDEAGLLHRITAAVSAAGAAIQGAKVATLGSEAVDVFFLVDRSGRPLTDDHAAAVKVTVLGSLVGQVP
jgi:[protein-PII] uridylyltransferase